jgi:hypothetical protein
MVMPPTAIWCNLATTGLDVERLFAHLGNYLSSYRYGILSSRMTVLTTQHSGHSRLIVGYEETVGSEINLLVLDPGRWVFHTLWDASVDNKNHAQRHPSGRCCSPHTSESTITQLPIISLPQHNT